MYSLQGVGEIGHSFSSEAIMKSYIQGNNYMRVEQTPPSQERGVTFGTGYFVGDRQVIVPSEVTLTVDGVRDLVNFLNKFLSENSVSNVENKDLKNDD